MVRAEPAGRKLLDVVKRQPKRLSLLDEPHLVSPPRPSPRGSHPPSAPAHSAVVASRNNLERLNRSPVRSAISPIGSCGKHPSLVLHGKHRPFDTFHCRNHITQAARTPGVPNITGATLRSDVLADPDNDSVRPCSRTSLRMSDSVSPKQ